MSGNTNKTIIFCFFILFLLSSSTVQSQTVSVKAAYWSSASQFPISNINSSLFTHLFCAFAALNSSNNQVILPPSSQSSFSSFTETLQQNNPSIKTLLSIGAGGSDATAFATMASNATSRNTFISSSINLSRSLGFHGMDLDWEYPATQDDMDNLGLLLTEWRSAIIAESNASGKAEMILTAALRLTPTVYSSNSPPKNYPVQSIATNLDWINLMAYDFYVPSSSNLTEPHAALYDPTAQVSSSIGVNAWNRSGLPLNKIALGLPFYGYAWKLVDPNQHGYLAPSAGVGGTGGGFGSMSYKDIRNFVAANGAVMVYNGTVVEDYCYSGSTWITYDDVNSVAAKVMYAKQKGLIGYFAWHVGADDGNFTLSTAAFQT